jgi:hypothetical protein
VTGAPSSHAATKLKSNSALITIFIIQIPFLRIFIVTPRFFANPAGIIIFGDCHLAPIGIYISRRVGIAYKNSAAANKETKHY